MSLVCADITQFYKKYKNLKRQDVSKIFEWLKENAHLPTLTELQVISFLQSSSCNVDVAKKTIENYFSFKTKSDIFVMIDENLVKKATSAAFMGVLPKKTPKNKVVVLIKFLDPTPEKYDCEECGKFLVNYLTLCQNLYDTSDGFIFIIDSDYFSLSHFWKMKLGVLRQVLYYVQEAAPLTMEKIHLINVSPVTKHLITCLRPFMKQEIYEMIKIHSGSIGSLYEYVPKNCLPEEYGGELESYRIINEKNKKTVLDNMKVLERLNAQNIDESKRKLGTKRGFFSEIYNYFTQ